MPKRTNDFQKLIANIYEQLSTPDELVVESALLKEPGSGVDREIDILLQKEIFGAIIRIAIECRGRNHKDDIQWIDSLIGKYRDLPVDKIIAVSKSGFSKAAVEKAEINRIDTLTLEEALETNWPNEFKRLGIAKVIRHDRPYRVQVITDETVENSINTSTSLYTGQGQQIGTIQEVAKIIYEQNKDTITKEISKHFLSFFKTLDDFNKHQVLVSVPVNPPHPTFIADGSRRLLVKQVILEMLCSYSYEPANVSHYLLGNRQVTQATIRDEQSEGEFIIRTIQEAKNPNQANVRVEKVDVKAKISS